MVPPSVADWFFVSEHVYIGNTSTALIMKAHYDPEIKAKALLRPSPCSLVGGGVAWAPMDSHDVC